MQKQRSFPLRYKMTLWYTALTLLIILVFFAALYLVMRQSLTAKMANDMQLTVTQLTAQVENDHGTFKYENEVPLSSNMDYWILDESGNTLVSTEKQPSLLLKAPWEEGKLREASLDRRHFMLLDSMTVNVDSFRIRVRIMASMQGIDDTLRTISYICLASAPLLLALAVAGGLFISKKSLLPIRHIINSAGVIAKGDLSERIPNTAGRDEVGELIVTINNMLASVESSFLREKRFTSDASHELRTPVSIIMAYAESLLADNKLSAEDAQAVTTILAESRRMQHIIAQLLAITRGQEGRYPVFMEEFPLGDIVEHIGEQFSDQLHEQDMKFEQDIPEGMVVKGDLSLISQMLLNLVENGIKYGKPGGYVRIAAKTAESKAYITVSDNGLGIPPESLPHIFERFYRADPARDRSGTGLGLSIVQWIVQAHHGDIQVESKVSQGTQFTIQIPN
jgi:signal transduction histidine kinase